MSTTREDAYDILKRDFEFMLTVAIEDAHGENSDIKDAKLIYKEQMRALSILAPEPRKEPPTKEEVGDGYGEGNEAWAFDPHMNQWTLRRGEVIRMQWGKFCTMWLPYSALPVEMKKRDQ